MYTLLQLKHIHTDNTLFLYIFSLFFYLLILRISLCRVPMLCPCNQIGLKKKPNKNQIYDAIAGIWFSETRLYL